MDAKRIMIICGAAKSLVTFRGDLIKKLLLDGHEVICVAPFKERDEAHRKTLKGFGAETIHFPLSRVGVNPVADLRSLSFLRKQIRRSKIDLVFPYTIKSVIYGSMAANMTGTPVISLITGLGFTFSRVSYRANILQKITSKLYRWALRKNRAVIFQNKDDRQLFLKLGILSNDNKSYIVHGSGVNLKEYETRIKTNDGQRIIFVIVARMIREKGIGLFMEAAALLKERYPMSEYHIIGPMDYTSSGIKKSDLDDFVSKGLIVYHGEQSSVVEFLRQSDVFVLPSFYREGVPRSILEALSIGMPIITTDAPGCRETVKDGTNGFLVAPKDLDSLVEAMEYMLQHPDKIEPMGVASRRMAREKFDVDKINLDILEIMETQLDH